MENYIVSARKYRPATFETVVGQKAITITLKNAVKNNHLAHAYLFCGPRGVGKTTCARIFAKIINCKNLSPEIEACEQCESCISFNNNRSYNIHELDAASNNSVEDIRSLTDQVRIPPQIGTHSVYIIDEVHMLSANAFNAFLKTLEEPPAHAIFILATTEKHKIIPTILSRCQIFDFSRIRIESIAEHLAFVAKKEGINAQPDALTIIAQKADGGMRDALSYFDQLVSFCGNELTYKQVIENLNVLDYDYYFRLTTDLLNNNIAESLLIFDDILNHGFDGHHFITGLSGHFRDLLVCKDDKTTELLEVGATIKDMYKKQAGECTIDFLYKALNITNTCDLHYKESRNKRLQVELALFQLCNINYVKKQESQEIATTKQQNQKEPLQKNLNLQAEIKTENQATQQPVQKTTTISIKDVLTSPIQNKTENIETVKTVNEQKPEYVNEELITPFSEEEFKAKWLNYAQQIKTERPRLSSVLSGCTPVIKSNFVIEVPLNNPLQKDELNERKGDLLNYLRKELKNSKIDLVPVIIEQVQQKKLFTDSDKYNFLSDKNASLNKLKQQFNLDFNTGM